MVTMADVADPAVCHFCGSSHIEWEGQGYWYCEDCSATGHYSQRLGRMTHTDGPEDLDIVSRLLHELRGLT